MVRIATLLIVALLSLPAFAASGDAADITMKIERGSVMTSQGGDFVSAKSGQVVLEGERLMVPEGSVVVLRYDNGCTRKYNQPGVYRVEAECVNRNNAVAWRDARKLFAGFAVAAWLFENQIEDQPISL